jgi:hypothetical protein
MNFKKMPAVALVMFVNFIFAVKYGSRASSWYLAGAAAGLFPLATSRIIGTVAAVTFGLTFLPFVIGL